jgi:TetR/AcrR family transcriptional repressor of cmeABC operon
MILKPKTKRASRRVGQLENRCQRFVEVAEQLFLEHGFAGTSVNEVVRIAGGSLATLYAEFGTKDELFEAVMNRRVVALFSELEAGTLHSPEIRTELLALARQIQGHVLSERSLAFFRLAIHEGPKFPSVRKAILINGLKGYLRQLASHFAALASAGRLQIEDPEIAAEDFLTLVQGQQRMIAACGDGARLSQKQRDDHLQHVVDAFLRIYPPPAPAKKR